MYTIEAQIRDNQNFNGGGLATNITGKFESNRHALAKMSSDKMTFGEAIKEMKLVRNGVQNFTMDELHTLFPNAEWHHAGKLPKQYGGGMKKTYFLTTEEVQELRNNGIERLAEIRAKKLAKETEEREAQETAQREADAKGVAVLNFGWAWDYDYSGRNGKKVFFRVYSTSGNKDRFSVEIPADCEAIAQTIKFEKRGYDTADESDFFTALAKKVTILSQVKTQA